jgi:hypothetical protein
LVGYTELIFKSHNLEYPNVCAVIVH